jgi:hypothetical protein
MVTPIFKTGSNGKKPSVVGQKVWQDYRRGTDEVEIGSPSPIFPGENTEVKGATMAEVAKFLDGIKYLVRGWIPFGMVTGIVAEPGGGKSAFNLWLARTVMTGCPWFNGKSGPKPGYVLWCPTENDMKITLKRMTDWHIPLDRFILPDKNDPCRPVDLTSADDLLLIEALITTYRTRLVVIDSLRGAHDGDENSSRVGKILQNLASIGQRTNAAITVVHHTRKLSAGEEITANSSRGSNAILALMRSLIGIDRPDRGSKWFRVRILKENLGLAPQPVGFLVTDSGLEFGPVPEMPGSQTEGDRAEAWLKKNMQPGQWYPAARLQEEADQAGFSTNALQRGREALGIVKPHGVRRNGTGSEWLWRR